MEVRSNTTQIILKVELLDKIIEYGNSSEKAFGMDRDVWSEVAMPLHMFETHGLMEPAWVTIEGIVVS